MIFNILFIFATVADVYLLILIGLTMLHGTKLADITKVKFANLNRPEDQ